MLDTLTAQKTLPLTEAYRPIRDDLVRVEGIFDDEVFSDFPFVNDLCDRVRAYRGKMLRPALLLLSGKAAGTLKPAHHTLGAVVEMVHMATLVHDDVLDEADVRRGRRTVNAVEGNVAAVLLGDYLISHAFHLCSSLDHQHASRRIGATTNIVCEGELMQNHCRGRLDLSEKEYFEMIRGKTAALTEVSCELGATFAGADDSVVEAMATYGRCAGIAFQIIDDVLDLVGHTEEMGKTLGRDWDLGKITLPMIHHLAQAGGQADPEAAGILGNGHRTSRKEICAVLEDSGSIAYAVATARRHVDQARRQLDALSPGEARSSLLALADFIVDRRV